MEIGFYAMICGDRALTLTEMLWEERCVLPAVLHHSFFFSWTTCQTGISSHETCRETAGWCLTQTSTSKWNLLFSFYAKCLKGYGWKWNYVYCFPIVPQSTERAEVGFWPLAKTVKSFIFFSPLTLRFWCGDVFLIKHGRINQSHGELYVKWWWCVWFYIAEHQIR